MIFLPTKPSCLILKRKDVKKCLKKYVADKADTVKMVRHTEMPKSSPQKVHVSFSKTRDDIEMK